MNWANRITILRILMVPVFVLLMLKYNQSAVGLYRWAAILVFGLAALSDALDGAIARARKEITELGKTLDPIADKLLLVSGVLLLSLPGPLVALPLWYVTTVLSRDLILFLGVLLLQLFMGNVRIQPNILGKITTVSQMVTILWVLLALPHPNVVWGVSGACTVVSGLFYVVTGSKQFNETGS